jgi:pimeloyl-ACP methyl ester carboxylesterase
MHIKLPTFSMAYDEDGIDNPIVFIHGYPLNRQIWEAQLRPVCDIARVLAPDLRGHGQSDSVPGPYTIETLADDIHHFLSALNVTQPVTLCGLSMGGYVAFAFYRKYKASVAALILTATRAGADSEEAKANRDKAAATAQAEGSKAIATSLLPKLLSPKTHDTKHNVVTQLREIMESASVETIVNDLAAIKNRPDSTPLLSEIDVPTLILHGEDDQLIPPKEAESMHAAIKASKLQLIHEAGHLLNMEQSRIFNDAVRNFLESL